MTSLNVSAISDLYNSRIINIWNDHSKYIEENKGYHPLQRTNLQKSDVVFVGMNPSFNKNWVRSKIKELGGPALDIEPDDLFTWNGPKSSTKIILALDNIGEKSHPYHKALIGFAKSVGDSVKYTSLDLYAWRQTSQNEFIKNVLPVNQKFFLSQQVLFFDVLAEISPKVVVVANATVCHFLKEKFKFVFDEKVGGYRLGIGNSNGPVYIFSGMLSGARALDIYSRERMSWHVRKVLGRKD